MKGADDELPVSQLSSSCNEISGNSIQIPVSKYSWTASRSCRSLVKMKYLLSRRLRPADSAVPYFHQVRLAASGLIFKDFPLNIKKLHKLEMYDCSAWTDWETVAKELQGQDIAVEVRMHPVKDVIMADEAHMREKLTRFREIFGGMRATVRADGFQVVRSMEEDTKQIQKFARIAAEMLR